MTGTGGRVYYLIRTSMATVRVAILLLAPRLVRSNYDPRYSDRTSSTSGAQLNIRIASLVTATW
jgi:hypothetical protein